MKTVELDFLEGWELLNAVEQRLDRLTRLGQPAITAQAMARLITSRDKITAAMGLGVIPSEAALDGAHEGWLADMADLEATGGLPDVPVASRASYLSWTQSELREAFGR